MPANNGKKTILLLCDDIRMHSGCSTMAREIVLGTAHKYNWVEIGGAITHPEAGKICDMSEATNKILGRNDCYVKVYPVNGYGDEDTVFAIMNMEKPDVLIHFTDPRFWQFLYLIERQIRAKVPLTYINVWDDLSYPRYNRAFYESCDLLMAISKQTYNINKQVLNPENCISLDGYFDKNGDLIPFNKENK